MFKEWISLVYQESEGSFVVKPKDVVVDADGVELDEALDVAKNIEHDEIKYISHLLARISRLNKEAKTTPSSYLS